MKSRPSACESRAILSQTPKTTPYTKNDPLAQANSTKRLCILTTMSLVSFAGPTTPLSHLMLTPQEPVTYE